MTLNPQDNETKKGHLIRMCQQSGCVTKQGVAS